MRQRIRLTESDLHRIIRRSVNKVLRESEEMPLDIDILDIARELMANGQASQQFIVDDTNCKLNAVLQGDNIRVRVQSLDYNENGYGESYGEEFEDEYELYYPLSNAIRSAVQEIFPGVDLNIEEL